MFTEADHAALAGDWSWLMTVVRKAMAGPVDGALDDDLAYNAPWGFDPARITAPVLILHGEADRVIPIAYGERLYAMIPGKKQMVRFPGGDHVDLDRHGALDAALKFLTEPLD